MRKRQRGTRPVSDEPLSAGRVEYLEQARERVRQLHAQGLTEARLYGANSNSGVGGTGSVFLLLDEPAAGLNPQEKKDLQGLIEQLRQQYGVAVLLIEHDMSLVMGVSERILVMEHGRPIALGTPDAIRNDERVIKAYLGEE